MKKLFFGHVFALIAGLALAGAAQAVDEGIDYRTLGQAVPTETGNKVEVLELFWYGCPHCYHLEPQLKQWLKNKPDYVEFRRLPAVLGRGWVNHGRAFFAAELLGVLDDLHEPLFVALHDKKMRLFDEGAIADWFAAQGVDREEFVKAYRSFIVDMKVRKVSQLGHRLGLDGVPSFVVNGKYVTSATQTGSRDRMFEVIDYLAAREAGVLPAAASPAEPEATSPEADDSAQDAAAEMPAETAETAPEAPAPEAAESGAEAAADTGDRAARPDAPAE